MTAPVAIVTLAALVGCADRDASAGVPSDSTTAATPSPVISTSAPPGAISLEPTEDALDSDVLLAEQFLAFALDPGEGTVQALDLSPTARLGLGSDLVTDLPVATAADPRAWLIDRPGFRAQSGPFSALVTLSQQRQAGGQPTSPSEVALVVDVGPHDRCASPGAPAPTGLASERQVSLQPSPATISSCLDWFAIDLYLDADARITAITLDLWEP
jgi:hypothetical protein